MIPTVFYRDHICLIPDYLRYAVRNCLFSSVCYRLTKPRHSYMTHVVDLRDEGEGPVLEELTHLSYTRNSTVIYT